MEDVSDAIRELGDPYTVTRRAAATMVNGYRVAGSSSTFVTTAVEDPIAGDELERMPEGQRRRGVRALFCDQELLTVGDPGGAEPDEVEISGVPWQVQTCQPWAAGGFWRVVVARK
jgi:hypothetical protein